VLRYFVLALAVRRKIMLRHLIKPLLAAIVATVTLAGCTVPVPYQQASYVQFSEYGEYLAENYGIRFDGIVTQNAYRAAVAAIFANAESAKVPAGIDQEGFTALEAVLTTVYIANIDAPGDVYTPARVEETLAAWPGAPEDLPPERRQELAAAIDSGLLDAAWRNVDLSQPPPAGFATDLLGNALQIRGDFTRFLEHTSEHELWSHVDSNELAGYTDSMSCHALRS
jgi:hypothetical protein